MLSTCHVVMLTAPAGATAVTDADAVPLIPFSAAVIITEPAATPLASPLALTVATALLEDVQAADEVTSAVLPSL